MYQRLVDRSKECLKLYDATKNTYYLMEDECIAHFFECEGFKTYEKIAKFCIERGFKRVIDIGCAYGHQSEVFLNNNMSYLGICDNELDYWNKDKFQYITKRYPFDIKAEEGDLAVSVLCLTWNCYLYEGEKTIVAQLEQLQKNFNSCLLYLANDKIDYVKRYFKNSEEIAKNLVYFSN